MPLRIRTATPSDVDALVELYRAAYRTAADLGYPSSVLDLEAGTVRSWLDDGDAAVYVAERGGELLGAVRLLEEREHPYGERLAVRPDAQGEGIGTHLREHVEGRARERGHDRLQIAAFDDHPFLLEHYREAGYEEFDRWDADDRPYEVVGLEKPL